MKAFIYYNLTSAKWSIKALEGPHKGLVVGHADKVQLKNCSFKVSQAGRERVLREQQKNVHAGVEGTIINVEGFKARKPVKLVKGCIQCGLWSERVTYNPYKNEKFINENGDSYILGASLVTMLDKKVYIN